jgi:putative DNA primase/helicase
MEDDEINQAVEDESTLLGEACLNDIGDQDINSDVNDSRVSETKPFDIAGFPPCDNRDDFEHEEKKISIIQQAGEQISNDHRFATIEESKRIYCYKGGVYVPGGEITIAKEAERLFHYQMSNHKVTEVEGHIKRRTFHERKEFDADPKIINVKNTLYDVTTAETRPHDPNYLSLNQSPIIYDPKAKPKLFGKFLSEVVYPEQIRSLVELMAYTFYRENPFEVITILHGSGLNGKSVLLGVLTALHGIENVSNTSLKTIGERPFALFDLVDKCVNIDEELSNGMIDDTAILKKITGRRPTRVEQKNLTSFEAVIYAKLWFSANEIPQTPEETDAFHRRINVVTFPNKFEDGKADPDKIKTLTTPEELSGIFNVLMIALRRVLNDKSIFSREKTIADQTRRYDMAVNPVASFVDLAFTEEHNGTDYVSKERVYQAYRIFCKEFKLAVISYGSFGKKMKKEGWPDKKITFADDKRHHCWTGLRLTDEYLEKIRLAGPSIIQETLDELR